MIVFVVCSEELLVLLLLVRGARLKM